MLIVDDMTLRYNQQLDPCSEMCINNKLSWTKSSSGFLSFPWSRLIIHLILVIPTEIP